MKKTPFRFFLLVLAFLYGYVLPAQVLRHETTAINIEVPPSASSKGIRSSTL
jgi:hypothetical protein